MSNWAEMAAPMPLSAEDVLRVNGSRRDGGCLPLRVPRRRPPRRSPHLARRGGRQRMARGLRGAPGDRNHLPICLQVEQGGAISGDLHSHGFDGPGAGGVECQRRYTNRPIVELENAAQEELKITELRLAKLFSSEPTVPSTATQTDKAAVWIILLSHPLNFQKDRIRIIGAHLGALPQPCANKAPDITGSSNRSRPPITTHVLDTARGSPASGIEVHLEMWKDSSAPPSFSNKDFSGWATLGYSVTNNDGRSGQLMDIVDNIAAGFYRISFNTSKYSPAGFFPYVSIIFEIKENQTAEHFHVPLLHSPFSFTTYRGS